MNIPVVIFCGGQGARMKEETEFRPKPMVSVGGKPILWHVMKIYAHYGFNDFILALGYKGDYIKDYFVNEKYFTHDLVVNTKTGATKILRESKANNDDFNITFVDTGLDSLTGKRLLQLKKYITGDIFMVTYGDGVGNIDIKDLVSYHKKKGVIGVITGVHPKSKWGLVVADKNELIERFQQKPRLNQYVNGGFMVFNRKVFDYLRDDEMIEVTLDKLVKDRELAVYRHNGYWTAMDTYQDLEEVNKQWLEDPKWKVW